MGDFGQEGGLPALFCCHVLGGLTARLFEGRANGGISIQGISQQTPSVDFASSFEGLQASQQFRLC